METKSNQQDCFSPMEAVSFMHELSLSKESLRKTRQFLASKSVNFPTTNEIFQERSLLRPQTESVLENKGRSVDYKNLVKMTSESILRIVHEKDQHFRPEHLKLYLKDGGDGAGSMPKLKNASSVDDEEHIFQYGLIPLKLTQTRNDNEVVIWDNAVMNSAKTLRSLFLIRDKEDNPELLELVIKSTDEARQQLNENGITISYQGSEVNMKIQIKDSMKDLKFKKKISGLGGADCLLCKSKQLEWTEDPSKIFAINRTAADTRAIFLSVLDENGSIKINPNDFDTRSGLTKEPLSNSDQHCITITHSYINGTSWFLKVLYRCYANWPVWVVRAGYKDRLSKSKDDVREAIANATGLRLDYVNSVCAKGGTSTDGKQGRRFFSSQIKPVLEQLLSKASNNHYKDNIILLHHQLSLILRIISCTSIIDVSKFKVLCKATILNISTNFPWARLNHTLHGAIQHSAELIEMNEGRSLGGYSEEGLEANNKDIRRFLENRSRKCDANMQLEDVHNRILERSDPYLIYVASRFTQNKFCRECGSSGHPIRSHKKHEMAAVMGLEEFILKE